MKAAATPIGFDYLSNLFDLCFSERMECDIDTVYAFRRGAECCSEDYGIAGKGEEAFVRFLDA